MRIVPVAATVVALMAYSGTPAGADATFDAISALDPQITHVRVFGEWKSETKAGRYRVTIVKTGEASIRFFIQKITAEQDVEATIELAEIAQNKLAVTGYNFDIDSFGLTLFVDTRDKASGEDVTYEVFLQEDGSYEFQPASN